MSVGDDEQAQRRGVQQQVPQHSAAATIADADLAGRHGQVTPQGMDVCNARRPACPFVGVTRCHHGWRHPVAIARTKQLGSLVSIGTLMALQAGRGYTAQA